MPHSSPKRTINRHFFAPLLSCVIPNCTWLCYEGKFEKVLPRLAFSEPPSPVPVFPLVPFVTLLVIPLGKIHGKIWERYHFFPNLIHQSLRILPHAAPERLPCCTMRLVHGLVCISSPCYARTNPK